MSDGFKQGEPLYEDLAATPGVVVHDTDPGNVEFTLSTQGSPLTSTENFYIRSHFPVPNVDAATWRLKVEGAVVRVLELSLNQVRSMAASTVTSILECAGNSRSFLEPAVKGVQWNLGAVGQAEWTGVRLGDILKLAGVRWDAVDVVLEGEDYGIIEAGPKPEEAIRYSRSVPVERAMRPEVLLAYTMNGRTLNAAHGFPLRAIVPGWYGMASVKWLTRIIVIPKSYQGYFQSVDYAMWENIYGLKHRVPITEIQTKSEILDPHPNQILKAGSAYEIRGAAWTGDSEIQLVEISDDEGRTWSAANLLTPSIRFRWVFWNFKWDVPLEKGSYALRARATDVRGNVQPLDREPDRETYVINHSFGISVEVS